MKTRKIKVKKEKPVSFLLMLILIIVTGTLLTSFLIIFLINVIGNNEASILRGDFLLSDPFSSLTVICCILLVLLLTVLIILMIMRQKSADIIAAEELRKAGQNRFYKLSQTDEEMKNYKEPVWDTELTLEEICNRFRNYSASRLKLYYDISTIRTFVASLTVSHIVIMQGISGTGKTSMACAFAKFTGKEPVLIPVQPFWKESSDMLGYFNEFTSSYNETELLHKLYEAGYNDEMYITVLDEMNIARVEYYFAEFLSLLEMPSVSERMIEITADSRASDPVMLKKGRLCLPDNMWYIGTANNDDSTLAISDKVYDRAMVITLDKRAVTFDAEPTDEIRISHTEFDRLADTARKTKPLSGELSKKINRLDVYLSEKAQITFGNRIINQIKRFVPAYVACGGTELEAIDTILCRKVLRKLEGKNPLYIKRISPELCDFLDLLFGENTMKECKEYLHNYELNM